MNKRSFLAVTLCIGFLVSSNVKSMILPLTYIVPLGLAANKAIGTICKVPTRFVTASQWLVKKYRLRGCSNKFEVVERLLSCGYHKAAEDIVDKCTKKEINNIFKTACDCGYLQVVKFLVDRYENEIADSINDEFNRICNLSCHANPGFETVVLEIVKLLVGTEKITNGFIKACSWGHVGIVKLFVDKYTKKEINKVFIEACGFGRLEVVKFLVGKCRKKITTDSVNKGFKEAFWRDKRKVVEFLVDKCTKEISNDSIRSAFEEVCGRDKTKIVKFFIDKCMKKGINEGFRVACYCGRLEVVKFFVDKYTKGDINEGFRVACYCGRLEVVKFLVDKCTKEGINEGFRAAYSRVLLKVVKFLVRWGASVSELRLFSGCSVYWWPVSHHNREVRNREIKKAKRDLKIKTMREYLKFVKDFDKKKKYKDKIEFIKKNKKHVYLRDILIRLYCKSVKDKKTLNIKDLKSTEICKICKNPELRDILNKNLFPENKNREAWEEKSLPLSFAKNKEKIKYLIKSREYRNDDFHKRLGYLLSQS